MMSPWFSAVRIVPTTRQATKDLFSIGQCRNAHIRHLVSSAAAPARLFPLAVAVLLKPKALPGRRIRPHASQSSSETAAATSASMTRSMKMYPSGAQLPSERFRAMSQTPRAADNFRYCSHVRCRCQTLTYLGVSVNILRRGSKARNGYVVGRPVCLPTLSQCVSR